MLNSPATRWHWGFHFLFLNSAILHSCIFGHSCLYLLKSPFNTWHLSIIFVGLSWFASIGMHVGIFQVFYPPFLYLGDEHVSWSTCFSQMACICLFVFLCPAKTLYGYIHCGFIPRWSGGSLIIFQLFRCRNVALNRIFILYLRQACSTPMGCLYTPYICIPYTFICPLYVQNPPVHSDTPICPPCSCASVCSGDICMWYGMGLFVCPHTFECPHVCMPPYVQHPHMSMPPCSPVHLYLLRGICIWYGGYTPYVGVGGHQQICQAFWWLSVHPLFSVCWLLLTGLVTWMSMMLHVVHFL